MKNPITLSSLTEFSNKPISVTLDLDSVCWVCSLDPLTLIVGLSGEQNFKCLFSKDSDTKEALNRIIGGK